jgi:hypothetical protein
MVWMRSRSHSHQDAGQAAAVGLDLDPRGAGVDGVVDQLLDGAGRPFDHLAGGDAVDGLGRQAADGHNVGLSGASRAKARIAAW